MKEYKIIDYYKMDDGIMENFFPNDEEKFFIIRKQEEVEKIDIFNINELVKRRVNSKIVKKCTCVDPYCCEQIAKYCDTKYKTIVIPNREISFRDISANNDNYICILARRDSDTKKLNVNYILEKQKGSLLIQDYVNKEQNYMLNKIAQKYTKAHYSRKKLRLNLKEPDYIIHPYGNNGECITNEEKKELIGLFVNNETKNYICQDKQEVKHLEDIVCEAMIDYDSYKNGMYSEEVIKSMNKLLEGKQNLDEQLDALENEIRVNSGIVNTNDSKCIENDVYFAKFERRTYDKNYWHEVKEDEIEKIIRNDEEYSLVICNKDKPFKDFYYAIYFDETDFFVYENKNELLDRNVWERIKNCLKNPKKVGKHIYL